jgi:hypothetical protein
LGEEKKFGFWKSNGSKTMRKAILSLSTLLLLTVNAHAIEFAESSLKDEGFTSKFEYFIDVYLVSTGDPHFEPGRVYLTLTYNANVLSNPVLSLENTDFHDNGLYDAMVLNNNTAGQTQLQVTASGATGTTLTGSEIRLGRISFTVDSTNYATESAGIDWVSAPLSTFVEDITGAGIFLNPTTVSLDGNTSLVCLPDISGTPDMTAEVGRVYSFAPSISDGCGAGPLDITITNIPDWADLDTVSGELSGAPDFTDINTYSGIMLTVEDAYGDATSLSPFDLNVICQPGPTLSGTPVTSITAGNNYGFTPTTSDGCGTLTYGIEHRPSWAGFDTTTGTLTGTPTLADVGTTNDIVIRVNDENGLTADLASFNIQVTADCVAPVISGTPDIDIAGGSNYSFYPTVSNGCGTLVFNIENQPYWTSFDTASGALTGTPEAADEGTYSDIVITATDELNRSANLAAFTIEVTDTSSSSNVSDDNGGSGGGGGGGGCFIATVR